MATTRQRGGSFLFEPLSSDEVLTPEALGPEHREIARTARDFATKEVRPKRQALEEHDWATARALLGQAGALGLLGVEVPEAYGGLGLDRVTAAVVAQELARGGASFAITFSVASGIGLLPLVYFGTPEQKRRYLPRLVSGEWVAAYALTEAGSGSDSLAARTVARLDPDGRHYRLSGTKQWITNGGFADLYTLYAKIDGQQFTSFLVERASPGVSTGPDEKKMGYNGSSTTTVLLDEAPVPAENLLHDPGKGYQVAFNTLNIGRFKLGPACLGAGVNLLGVATRHAQERQQFGRPIASFRLIQQKLADIAIRLYALGAATYRLAALMDGAEAGLDLAGDAGDAAVAALGEYAIECSILKVLATEALDFIVDEAVQIHGGYGYMREFEVEAAYRDSRVNRIFEGTNEINRLLIPGTLFRRAARGEAPVQEAAQRAGADLARLAGAPADGRDQAEVARALFWAVTGLALRKYGQGIDEEQETLALLADLAIDTFALESALARAARAAGGNQSALHRDLADAYADDAYQRILGLAREAFGRLADGDERRAALGALAQLTPATPADRVERGRRIAEQVIAAGGWPLAL
ncbi:MAG TPA: acyl-CoA dehydrogenase family protein [Thermomicrobiales bacterium]|nr:acyl-CoA dehydrogenase family protein [Thermomicrobiales bacterium]